MASYDSSSQQPLADPTVNAALLNLAAVLAAKFGTECKVTIEMGAHSTHANAGTTAEVEILTEDVVPAFAGNDGVFVVFSEEYDGREEGA